MKKQIIKLSGKEPVRIGRKRYVFAHPADPDLLIKVFRSRTNSDEHSPCRKKLQDIYRRYSYMTCFMRDFREYIYSRYGQQSDLVNHLQTIVGLVDTDLGLGLVVTGFFDVKGRLAPTLNSLILEGQMNPEREKKLEEFFNKIINSVLVVGDLNVRNIVLAYHPDKGEYFALVDGLGDKTFIPIHRLSKWINRYRKKKRIQQIKKRIKKSTGIL